MSDELTTDQVREIVQDALDAREYCARCDHADHRCPGCGIDVPHGMHACERCNG